MNFKLISLLTISAISCCETTKFTIPPPRAERIQPKQEWRELWKDVEKCSELSGNFDNVRWFKSLEKITDSTGAEFAGRWYYPHDIYLAPENVEPESGWTEWYKQFNIKHEILHDLSQTDTHPKAFDICRLTYNP